MIATLAAALLLQPAPPSPPPPPPGPPPRDIAVDNAYRLACRVTAKDGTVFDLEARVAGAGSKRKMRVRSGAPDRFPSGTARSGGAQTLDPAPAPSRYWELFRLKRPEGPYSVNLSWAGGGLREANLSHFRRIQGGSLYVHVGTASCRTE